MIRSFQKMACKSDKRSLLTFNALNQGGFLSTDVGTGSHVNVHIKIVSSAAGVLADQAGLVGLVDGDLDIGGLVVEFSPDVDVS